MQNGGKRPRYSLDQWDTVSAHLFGLRLRAKDDRSKVGFPCSAQNAELLRPDIVMDRDRRLTGYVRGQTDNVEAPPGFELNNPWKVSPLNLLRLLDTKSEIGREAVYVRTHHQSH